MTVIEQIRKARDEMENAIQFATVAAVKEFRLKTGMTPQGISIDMIEVTSIGQEKQYIVGNVAANVCL